MKIVVGMRANRIIIGVFSTNTFIPYLVFYVRCLGTLYLHKGIR